MTPKRITPALITFLAPNEIFVFGSNLAGRHGKGAALQALKFGAKYNCGFGIMGQTFALPTKDLDLKTMPLHRIKIYVDELLVYVRLMPESNFLVTKIGCGLAGYTPEQIAPLFRDFVGVGNVALPEEFLNILNK